MFEEVLRVLGERSKLESESTSTEYALPTGRRVTPKAYQDVTAKRVDGPVSFVDGGNAPVYDSPEARVEFVRACAITLSPGGERVIDVVEGLVLVTLEEARVVVKGFDGLDLSFSLALDDPAARRDGELSLSRVAGLARFTLECNLAAECVTKHSATLVVRDGSLVGRNAVEENSLDSIKAPLVAGLSKTTSLATRQGEGAASKALREGPRGAWLLPLGSANGLSFAFVKLHERSKHAFRLDVLGDENVLGRVAAALAVVAGDPVFPGYAFPLVEADHLARVSDEERESLRVRFAVEAGSAWDSLEATKRSLDAHEILDSLSSLGSRTKTL